MIDNYNPDIFEQLKQEVETLVGRSIKTPKDFEFLSCQIEGYTRETISVSTLKRMWGYVASPCNPSKYNLNLLSRMVGYPDWASFVGGQEGLASSRFFVKSKLIADALQKGELVRLTWCPGRVLTIMYKGNDIISDTQCRLQGNGSQILTTPVVLAYDISTDRSFHLVLRHGSRSKSHQTECQGTHLLHI